MPAPLAVCVGGIMCFAESLYRRVPCTHCCVPVGMARALWRLGWAASPSRCPCHAGWRPCPQTAAAGAPGRNSCGQGCAARARTSSRIKGLCHEPGTSSRQAGHRAVLCWLPRCLLVVTTCSKASWQRLSRHIPLQPARRAAENSEHAFESVGAACCKSMGHLGLEYLDLYLV